MPFSLYVIRESPCHLAYLWSGSFLLKILFKILYKMELWYTKITRIFVNVLTYNQAPYIANCKLTL